MRFNGFAFLLAGNLLLGSTVLQNTLTDSSESSFPHEVSNAVIHKTEIVDPVENKDSFSAVLYNNRNGLPTSEANDIVETGDGFIWIGSYSGLVRYDGNTFERIDSTTGISNVGDLFVDSRDRLWIGTNDSGVAMMDKGELYHWTEADGLRTLNVSMIAEDDKGIIYVSTAAGIYMFDEELNMSEVEDPRIKDMYVDMLRTGADGMIYGLSGEDDLFFIRDGKVINYLAGGKYEGGNVIQFLQDPKNPDMYYMGTQNANLYYGSIGSDVTIIKEIDISPLYYVMDLEAIDGKIWICTRRGIGVLDGDTLTSLEDLPMNNSVGSCMTDYEGNLWFTSTRQGIMKLVPNQFSDLFERYGLENGVVNTTCMNDGDLFIGMDTGLIITRDDEVLTEYPLESAVSASGKDLGTRDLLELLNGCRIRSILPDSLGRLWISTWRACGLLCYDHGNVTAYTREDGMLSSHVRAVTEGPDGTIYVAVTGGVNLIKDGKVVGSYGAEDGITNPETLTVAAAPNGDIVLGSDGGGIFIVHDGKVSHISTLDGLSSGIILRIKWDDARHLFWIVTSNTITYMTEDYEFTAVQKFPYSNNFDLYENKQNEMWVISSNGIYVLPTDELLANEEINPIHFGIDNGMPCIATANSYSYQAENGDFYLAGNSGVAKVNIEDPVEEILDLKISVPFIDADNERIYPDDQGTFHLPYDVQKLTIYSYVFNYSQTNPTVYYRLEGFDKDYMKMSRSELGPAVYTNLPGGTYRFVIRLKDSQERTGKTMSATIVKEKALYEETWFYVICVIGGLALIVAGIWVYISHKTKSLEQKNREAIRKERLNTELKMAGRIQENALPHVFPPYPDRDEFEIYASMNPAREVGGDFYDFFLIDDDHLCLVMADVSGKGIPASLFMMTSKSILQSAAKLGHSASEILTKANDALCADNQVDMFVTVWIGILDVHTGKVTAANAGHEYPAIMQNGEFTLMMDKHGFVLGGMEGVPYTEYEFEMKPGDKLFLYTDGVPEATAKDNQMFGTDRMLEALNEVKDASPQEILEGVNRAVSAFVKDAEQFDDLTMMCIEFKGDAGNKAAEEPSPDQA